MYATIEERVAHLEGKVEEHSRVWEDLKDMMIAHEGKMVGLEQRIDRRFEAIDRRFEAIEARIGLLDQKFSRFFLWIIGFQFSTLLTLIAILLK